MNLPVSFRLALVLCLLLHAIPGRAQSDDGVSLGAFARSVRQQKLPPAPVMVDNDNLFRVLEEVQSERLSHAPLFSLNGPANTFEAKYPDGTCSLSFNANTTSLLTAPYVTEALPQDQLALVDGPASVDSDKLKISVYNGTNWNLKEVTVGLTIVRHADPVSTAGVAKLVPAVASSPIVSEAPDAGGKPSDLTVIMHLKGSVAPLTSSVFEDKLPATLAPGQEWHWAIMQAKGIPPSPLSFPAPY